MLCFVIKRKRKGILLNNYIIFFKSFKVFFKLMCDIFIIVK